MKRPIYIKDSEGRMGTDHVKLLQIADRVRLGEHEAASMLAPTHLDAMVDLIAGSTGEDRAQLALKSPTYIAVRYSLARRADDNATTIRQPSAAAHAEKKARDSMVADSRNASRPKRHADHAPPKNAREREVVARRAMLRDSANAWRRSKP